jgi:hypothetical protein
MPLATADVEFVLNDLRIKLPGASDAGILQELWNVIKEFLQDSNSWIEQQKLLVTAGLNTYNITPRDGGQIIRLVGVRDGNGVPARAAMQALGTLCISQPISVTSVDRDVNLFAAASTSATDPWRVCIVKNIQLPGTKDKLPIAPVFVLQVYSQTIIDGVLGKMMLHQGQTFTNTTLAKYHLARFRDGIGIARTDVWNQNVQGGQRWAFPQQFAACSQRGYTSTAQPWPMETF